MAWLGINNFEIGLIEVVRDSKIACRVVKVGKVSWVDLKYSVAA